MISFVIPIFNEEDVLPELHSRLSEVVKKIDDDVEVVLVDDGSRDRSVELMKGLQQKDSRYKIVELSRNFGHQSALTAGCETAKGDAVITIDADLQDPPEAVLEMIQEWKQGADIVHGVRKSRGVDTFFKRNSANLFYALLNRVAKIDAPPNSADFRLIDRRALDAFIGLKEKNRYIRGLVSWIGFNQKNVYYDRAERFAGETKYPFSKMLSFAVDAMVSFSNFPIRMCSLLGLLMAFLSFTVGVGYIVAKILGYEGLVVGWTSLIVLISFIGGVQMFMIGVVGEYVSRIVDEVRNRPLYIIKNVS